MFVNPKELKRLMKEAFKANHLIIGNRDDMYYFQGSYWKVLCQKKFVPKTILAEIVELAGEIPGDGECFDVGKEGNQMQVNLMEIEIPEDAKPIEITDFILISRTGVAQRVLQFADTGNVCLLNTRFVAMTKGKHYEEDEGETPPSNPVCDGSQVFWENDVMRFSACLREDEEHINTLYKMRNIPLYQKEEVNV